MNFKKFMKILSLLFTSMCLFSACDGAASGKSPEVQSKPFTPEIGKRYVADATEYMTFASPDSTHHIVQGGYFDGKTFYIAFIKDDNPSSGVYIEKINTKGKVIKKSDLLPLDHANNITFNSKKNKLLVTHCQGQDMFSYATYSFVNPKTLKIESTDVLDYPFFSMAYSSEKDAYASGEWGGEVIDTWDGELNHLNFYEVEAHKSTTSQGVFADGSFIWFVRSGNQYILPEIVIYDWEGKEQFNILIENITVEPESINFVDGVAYIICNNSDYTGGIVYTLDFTEIKSAAD